MLLVYALFKCCWLVTAPLDLGRMYPTPPSHETNKSHSPETMTDGTNEGILTSASIVAFHSTVESTAPPIDDPITNVKVSVCFFIPVSPSVNRMLPREQNVLSFMVLTCLFLHLSAWHIQGWWGVSCLPVSGAIKKLQIPSNLTCLQIELKTVVGCRNCGQCLRAAVPVECCG